MSMLDWAKKEIELACVKERENAPENEWDYGCACYDSALRAFESLIRDNHSGMSIGITKRILNRLIDGKPLTVIDDVDDIWNKSFRGIYDDYDTYQCKRMSSLFKRLYDNGKVEYTDNNRIICENIDSGCRYNAGYIRRIIEKRYPITMPYMPEDNPYVVYTEDFLYDPKNGDFDTVGLIKLKKPNGDIEYLNIYLADRDGRFVEIDESIYMLRKTNPS